MDSSALRVHGIQAMRGRVFTGGLCHVFRVFETGENMGPVFLVKKQLRVGSILKGVISPQRKGVE